MFGAAWPRIVTCASLCSTQHYCVSENSLSSATQQSCVSLACPLFFVPSPCFVLFSGLILPYDCPSHVHPHALAGYGIVSLSCSLPKLQLCIPCAATCMYAGLWRLILQLLCLRQATTHSQCSHTMVVYVLCVYLWTFLCGIPMCTMSVWMLVIQHCRRHTRFTTLLACWQLQIGRHSEHVMCIVTLSVHARSQQPVTTATYA